MDYNLVEYMQGYIASLKAAKMWLHSAHHVTKGPGFLSDHNDLYGTMYVQIEDHYDILIEKSIGLSGTEEVACPLIISSATANILNKHFTSPINKSSKEIVSDAIVCISNLINSLSSLHTVFQKSGYLTLGMEDALSTMSNEYEKYLYFLGQRYKE